MASPTTPNPVHIDSEGLANRWGIETKTLSNWRVLGKGPRYIRIGSRVRYPMSEIIDYERKQLVATGGDIA